MYFMTSRLLVTDFVKTDKSYETVVTRTDIKEISLNTHISSFIRLPTKGMTYSQKCFRQSL